MVLDVSGKGEDKPNDDDDDRLSCGGGSDSADKEMSRSKEYKRVL